MKNFVIILFLFTSVMFAQKELPNVSVKSLDNKNVSIKEELFEKDKLYVISFWATWCGPCLNELEAISEVYEDWKKEINVEVVAVSIDDTRTQKRVKPLVSGKNWPFTIMLDSNQDLKRALAIVDVPYTIIVKNGSIINTYNGYMQGAEKKLFEYLKTVK